MSARHRPALALVPGRWVGAAARRRERSALALELPSLPAPDDRGADVVLLLAAAERDLVNASRGHGVEALLARSVLAQVRGARALLR